MISNKDKIKDMIKDKINENIMPFTVISIILVTFIVTIIMLSLNYSSNSEYTIVKDNDKFVLADGINFNARRITLKKNGGDINYSIPKDDNTLFYNVEYEVDNINNLLKSLNAGKYLSISEDENVNKLNYTEMLIYNVAHSTDLKAVSGLENINIVVLTPLSVYLNKLVLLTMLTLFVCSMIAMSNKYFKHDWYLHIENNTEQ